MIQYRIILTAEKRTDRLMKLKLVAPISYTSTTTAPKKKAALPWYCYL